MVEENTLIQSLDDIKLGGVAVILEDKSRIQNNLDKLEYYLSSIRLISVQESITPKKEKIKCTAIA